MDDYSTRQMDRHHPQKAPRFERNDTDEEWMGIKLKSLDRVPTDDARSTRTASHRTETRSFVRSFVSSSSVRPSPEPTSRARVSRRVQPSDDDVVVDEPPTVGSVRAVDRRTPRRGSRACTVYAFSTSKDSKKLIKFHFFFQTDDDANRRTRRRSPIDVLLFPRRACRPDDDGWMDAKCPPRPDPKKKTGFGIFNLWRVVNRRKVYG
jgi:hypothetical protein